MLIFVGASASGKTELAYYLKKNYHYHKCSTTTTRPKRHHETQDVDYHFVEDHTFNTLKINKQICFGYPEQNYCLDSSHLNIHYF